MSPLAIRLHCPWNYKNLSTHDKPKTNNNKHLKTKLSDDDDIGFVLLSSLIIIVIVVRRRIRGYTS